MINSFADLAEYFGTTPDEAALDRAIYKSTRCGAWLKLVHQKQVTVREYWHCLTNPHGEMLAVSSFKNGGEWNDNKGWISSYEAPQAVRDFVGLDNPAPQAVEGVAEKSSATMADLRASHASGLIIRHRNTCVISFYVNITKSVPADGIKIGSIVEGCDADVIPNTLYFPFDIADFEHVIEEIEYEAAELWYEYNS